MGNKSDMDEAKRKVPFSKGQALADEFGIRFFETSAKAGTNVNEVCKANGSSGLSPAAGFLAQCVVLALTLQAIMILRGGFCCDYQHASSSLMR